MQKDNELLVMDAKYGGYHQQKIIGNRMYQNIFSAPEYEIINQTLNDLSDANASEISDYSHEDIPRKKTDDMKIIPYDLVKKRTYPYSILEREKKKAQAFAMIRVSGIYDDLADEPDLYEDYRQL